MEATWRRRRLTRWGGGRKTKFWGHRFCFALLFLQPKPDANCTSNPRHAWITRVLPEISKCPNFLVGGAIGTNLICIKKKKRVLKGLPAFTACFHPPGFNPPAFNGGKASLTSNVVRRRCRLKTCTTVKTCTILGRRGEAFTREGSSTTPLRRCSGKAGGEHDFSWPAGNSLR